MQLIANHSFLNQLEQLRDRIYRITKRMLISQEEAQDATQEVIIKLWQMQPDNRAAVKSIEAYSITMAKNYCMDRLKSKQAQNLSLEPDFNGPVEASLSKKIETSDALKWVEKLIDQLPENERMIIQLREIENFEYKEISEIMELPEGTVRVYLSRIRKKIRKQFLEIQNHGIRKN